eukprot:Hpha_TRINITY_DN33969_c0_g1::TRINITY_DN33969_c0_g1_i1::g.69502::m.69502
MITPGDTPQRRYLDAAECVTLGLAAFAIWIFIAYSLFGTRESTKEVHTLWSIENKTCAGSQIRVIEAALSSTSHPDCGAAACIDGILSGPPPTCGAECSMTDRFNVSGDKGYKTCCPFSCTSTSHLCATMLV